MKKTVITFILSMVCLVSFAQIKMHSNGQVSFQSTNTVGGVQIDNTGKSSFEPNITLSGASITETKVKSQYVKAWSVRYTGTDINFNPKIRFYVSGVGDAYANNHYSIYPSREGGSNDKGSLPIENASELLLSLNGYYYDNNEFEGFEPDFIGNPNILPEAVEGMMKDLKINKSLGLSADDLEAVLPEAIRHDPEGMIYINYSAIIPVLVEAFKEQQHTIESLQKEISDLKTNDKGYNGIENQESTKNALYQNTPNPTNSSTTIKCYLDSYAQKAIITVYDLNGLQLKEYPVYHQGKNTITIGANEFKPGIYMYSLLVDGKLIDTKRMVITSK